MRFIKWVGKTEFKDENGNLLSNHACFEVYLVGYWIMIDATNLVPINGLIKLATGVDATDTALASIFGNLQFQKMEVSTTLQSEKIDYLDYNSTDQGYSYHD